MKLLTLYNVSLIIVIISLVLSGYVYWQGRAILIPLLPSPGNLLSYRLERGKILQKSADTMQNDLYDLESKYVDIRHGYSIYVTETGFHTQFSFSNVGVVPATDFKIILTYPAGTEIQKITPPLKHTESEGDLGKLVILEIQSLDVDRSMGILVASSHEPTGPPIIQDFEQKGEVKK